MYRVNVLDGDRVVGMFAAEYDGHDEHLARLLRMVGLTYCQDRRSEDGPVKVQIWDEQRQEWHNPSGRPMPDDWDGVLVMRVEVKVGSWNG